MTKLLEKVFAQVEKLPELEQNALAKLILDELASEKRWNKVFADSEDALENLAKEALEEHKNNKTKFFDVEDL